MRHESWKLNFSKPYLGAPASLIVAERAGAQNLRHPPQFPGGEPMLSQSLSQLSIATSGEGFLNLTSRLNRQISASGLVTGVAMLVCLHTSCSLTINENADSRVLEDLAAYLRALVPQEGVKPISGRGALRTYSHADEGPDDMPAHIRTALTCTSLSLSFQGGRLLLGLWQAVYLWEHRQVGSNRQLSLHLIGEA